jgi:hypothetical protein
VITGELKAEVDRIWDAFWSGGFANPLEIMEQITYEPPFTSLAAGGPETLFPDADVDALIDAIRAVGENALARDEVA